MLKEKSINWLANSSIKLTKLAKTLNYYLNQNYKNLNSNISSRIILADISLEVVKDNFSRPEYRLFIIPQFGLPEIKIKNPASFLYFCNIHKFFPIVNEIRFKDGPNVLKVSEIKDFIFLVRLFHLFFYKGYDYVLYDVVRSMLKQENIKKIFENKNLLLPLQSELFSLLKLLEDIKKTTFDIPKYHLHEKLGKLNNNGTLRENIFLEVAMKYENTVRKYLDFENTYLEFASFEDDTQRKIDFYLMYLRNTKNKKNTSYKKTPIQFTVSYSGKNKFIQVKKEFMRGQHDDFIYVEVNGSFKDRILEVENLYKEWINAVENRNRMDSSYFPFFINTLDKEFLFPALVAYLGIHLVISNQINIFPNLKIQGFNFSNLKITQKTTFLKKNKKHTKTEVIISKDNNRLCRIVYFKKYLDHTK